MIPFILATVGGYFIGNALKDKQIFSEGGEMDSMLKLSIKFVDGKPMGIWTERSVLSYNGRVWWTSEKNIEVPAKDYYDGKVTINNINWYIKQYEDRHRQRIDRMVEDWNKYGYAFSYVNYDDSEFFEKIGRTYSNTPSTSFTGNDIAYYDDKRVEKTAGGLKEIVKDYADGGVLELMKKEKLTQSERDEINRQFPDWAKKYLFYDEYRKDYLNLDVYSEYEHDELQLRKEQGL